MTTIINGSSPSITFSDSTTQTTAFTSTPSVTSITTSADSTINGLTVGKGGGSNAASNTILGTSAGAAATSADATVAIGQFALSTNTSGTGNTALGYRAMAFNNTTGGYNTAVGGYSLLGNTTGINNTAVGYQALFSNTTASNNTAVGYQAGYSLTGIGSASYNAFFGDVAGYSTTSGIRNLFLGSNTGYSNTTGSYNTYVGGSTNCGYYMTTGSKNTIIGGYNGNQGGLDIRTASNYIVLSDGDGNPNLWCNSSKQWAVPTNSVNSTSRSGNAVINLSSGSNLYDANFHITDAVANNAYFGLYSGSAYVICNSGGVTLASGATSWSGISDERLKDIIEPISDAANKVSNLRAVIGKYKTDEEGTRRSFLIAQDVQKVLPEAVDETNPNELSIRYTEIIPLLVAAVKEQQAIITDLKTRIQALESK